jgi:hypothetical protein
VDGSEPRALLERDPEDLARELVCAVPPDPTLQVPVDGREVAVEDDREELRLLRRVRQELGVV